MSAEKVVGFSYLLSLSLVLLLSSGCVHSAVPEVVALPDAYTRQWPEAEGLIYGKGVGFTEAEAVQAGLLAIASRLMVEVQGELQTQTHALRRGGEESIHESTTQYSRQQVKPLQIRDYGIAYSGQVGRNTYVVVSANIGAMRQSALADWGHERGGVEQVVTALLGSTGSDYHRLAAQVTLRARRLEALEAQLWQLGLMDAVAEVRVQKEALDAADTAARARLGIVIEGAVPEAVRRALAGVFKARGFGIGESATGSWRLVVKAEATPLRTATHWQSRLEVDYRLETTAGVPIFEEQRVFNGFSRVDARAARENAEAQWLAHAEAALVEKVLGAQ